MPDLKEIYTQRTLFNQGLARQLGAKYTRFAWVRLGVFILGIALSILLCSLILGVGLAFIAFFLVAFYRFVIWHQKIKQQQKHHENLVLINDQERAAIDHDYSAFDPGNRFVNPSHPYSLDLDLFGPYSFFQYSNRTSTTIGQNRLAEYLTKISSLEEVRSRQLAVEELKDQLDWRQEFRAYGLETEDDLQHLELLRRWLKAPSFVSNKKLLVASLYIMPFWSILGLMLWIFIIPWQAALLFLFPPVYILKKTLDQVNQTHIQTTHAEKILAFYSRLIAYIEKGHFTNPKLLKLQGVFTGQENRASKEIKKLSYIISQLNVRYNIFAIFLNIGGLWDLQWVYRLERWKARLQDQLPAWFEALQEFEALSSLATVYYNNSDWTFPELWDQPLVEAEEMGHPLIHAEKRICNDINIPTLGHIKLITGSNMAGKSTFLRTVGINIILAMAGAPVCAKRFSLPRMQVYTSMRTQDALHESTSSFYAELKRLKFIIEAVEEKNRPLQAFFLLDEILKGTNSVDRHTGSKALIQQLIKSKGSGLIATHDLELGALEATAEGAIENLCIEVEIKDGKLFFDYKLKKGVSKSFNATLLMQNMGIRV